MQSDRVSWPVIMSYGGLGFPLAAAFLALQVIIPTFYAQVTGMSLSVVGFVLLAARLWDTFTDPVIGHFSDRTPQRFGRRKIWVIVSAPLICISCWALFNPPANAGAWYLLLWTFAIYVSGTMTIIPMNAWGAELSADYHERSRVTGSRVSFGLIGILVALIITAIFGTEVDASGNVNYQKALFMLTLLVVATMVIANILAYIFVPDDNIVDVENSSFRSALSLIKKPSPFRTLIVSFLINATGSAIPATLFLLYVTHVMGMADKAGQFLFIYFICAAISVPFWVALAKRYGKHQVWSAAMVMGCCFFIVTPFIGEQYYGLFLMAVIGTGLATGADLSLPSAINADLIEWDALETGNRRPGIFFALWGTTTKLAYALAIGITFPLLELLNFDVNITNAPEAITSLAWLYGFPCVVCKLIAVYLMRNYPITQDEHNRIRQELLIKS